MRAPDALFDGEVGELRDRLDGFAETHLVGEDAVHLVFLEVGEPVHALDLVGAHDAVAHEVGLFDELSALVREGVHTRRDLGELVDIGGLVDDVVELVLVFGELFELDDDLSGLLELLLILQVGVALLALALVVDIFFFEDDGFFVLEAFVVVVVVVVVSLLFWFRLRVFQAGVIFLGFFGLLFRLLLDFGGVFSIFFRRWFSGALLFDLILLSIGLFECLFLISKFSGLFLLEVSFLVFIDFHDDEFIGEFARAVHLFADEGVKSFSLVVSNIFLDFEGDLVFSDFVDLVPVVSLDDLAEGLGDTLDFHLFHLFFLLDSILEISDGGLRVFG